MLLLHVLCSRTVLLNPLFCHDYFPSFLPLLCCAEFLKRQRLQWDLAGTANVFYSSLILGALMSPAESIEGGSGVVRYTRLLCSKKLLMWPVGYQSLLKQKSILNWDGRKHWQMWECCLFFFPQIFLCFWCFEGGFLIALREIFK